MPPDAWNSPWPPLPRWPVTHSNMNCTPSRWCGRSHRVSMGSTSTTGLLSPSGGCHSTSGSPGGGPPSCVERHANAPPPCQTNFQRAKLPKGCPSECSRSVSKCMHMVAKAGLLHIVLLHRKAGVKAHVWHGSAAARLRLLWHEGRNGRRLFLPTWECRRERFDGRLTSGTMRLSRDCVSSGVSAD